MKNKTECERTQLGDGKDLPPKVRWIVNKLRHSRTMDSVDDLAAMSLSELLAYRGFGPTHVKAVSEFLKSFGLVLKRSRE